MCGEQSPRLFYALIFNGSSPRVRGTVIPLQNSVQNSRFIPACAGNSSPSWPCSRRGRFIPACAGNRHRVCKLQPVHPRVCGEQWSARPYQLHCPGSSPRVRGTGPRPNRKRPCRRFIPACAGNSPISGLRRLNRAVHPRVCGEQMVRPRHRVRRPGSSPRVRGTVAIFQPLESVGRFIPACAGNSITATSCSIGSTVHPRVCGEQ